MNGYLIDTNVLSEFGKTQPPEPTVKQWIEAADPASLFASVVTWGELRKGIESKPHAQRRPGLEQWLERDLRDWFQSRLLPVTKTIADRWGVLVGAIQIEGQGAHDGRRPHPCHRR